MVRIEAIIHPSKLDEVKAALVRLEIEGVTSLYVLEHSGLGGLKTTYRAAEYRVDIQKLKLEMVVSSLRADEVVEAICRAARTGKSGDDGRVLIYEIAQALRICDGRG